MTTRRVLVLAHTGRPEARRVAAQLVRALREHDVIVRLLDSEAAELGLTACDDLEVAPADERLGADCELAMVIGGDGTLLRAVELTHPVGTPLLGVNLGHVGFLAEAEAEDVDSTIAAVLDRHYVTEDRITLEVDVFHRRELVARTFALNEASVEKAARERMLEVVVEIDGRPLSRWGCDGVVCCTPTGSTAYGFSAGGPIVWPSVEALIVVPISAHALFARPVVVGPDSEIAVEVLARAESHGVLWCDGRRTFELPPGARIEVRRGTAPVRLIRLHEAPFTDRLVRKLGLPVSGWRGAAEDRRNGATDA